MEQPNKMSLVEITSSSHEVTIDLRYATKNNFTNKKVYTDKRCYLDKKAEINLSKAIKFASQVGFKIKILDAYRPPEAQWILWEHTPDPTFLSDPKIGSPHSKGIAVDITLLNKSGEEIDMGTDFDSFTEKSYHGNTQISKNAMKNRLILLGIMTTAGWDFYRNEWWHYQLFNSKSYPLIQHTNLTENTTKQHKLR